MSDAEHAITKACHDARNDEPEERKRKCIAAAPLYLKGRVERGEELPKVEKIGAHDDDDSLLAAAAAAAAAFEYVVMEGKMAPELFVELMQFLVPKWEDERRKASPYAADH